MIIVTKCRKHGHLTEEQCYYSESKNLENGFRYRCKECYQSYNLKQSLETKQKKLERIANWKKENRDRINNRTRLDRQNNPEKYKKWEDNYKQKNREILSLKKSLSERKMNIDDYHEMLSQQESKCAICKQPETRMARDGKTITRLCIDHDHDTNEVRALLCHDCNTMLGKAKDCPELLIEAAHYLVDFKGWTE